MRDGGASIVRREKYSRGDPGHGEREKGSEKFIPNLCLFTSSTLNRAELNNASEFIDGMGKRDFDGVKACICFFARLIRVVLLRCHSWKHGELEHFLAYCCLLAVFLQVGAIMP